MLSPCDTPRGICEMLENNPGGPFNGPQEQSIQNCLQSFDGVAIPFQEGTASDGGKLSQEQDVDIDVDKDVEQAVGMTIENEDSGD